MLTEMMVIVTVIHLGEGVVGVGGGSNNLLYGVIIILAFTYSNGSQTTLCGALMLYKPEQNSLLLISSNGDLTTCREIISVDGTFHNMI
jgi:hypothetical protein